MIDKLNLPRDEMAFRKIYKDLVLNKEITTVFRPGKRLCGDFRGYCPGEKITIRLIENAGADWAKVPPQFDSEFKKEIEIVGMDAMKISDLKSDDFIGSSPDVHDTKSLQYQIGLIYNLSFDDISEDAIVTKIQFKYK